MTPQSCIYGLTLRFIFADFKNSITFAFVEYI
jgi:hypothetical protein